MAEYSEKDYLLEVIRGNVNGLEIISFNGHNEAVGTNEETLWPEGGLYAFPSEAITMTVSSSSSSDDVGESGLTAVLISGLDENYAALTETVIMNGTTAVTTTKSFLRINTMIGQTAGSTGSNVGTVYIGTGVVESGKPATVYNLISVGNNLSDSGFYTVANGRFAYVVNAIFTAESGKGTELAVYTTGNQDAGLTLRVAEFELGSGPTNLVRLVPFRKIQGRTDIEIRALSGQSSDCKSFVSLVIEKT